MNSSERLERILSGRTVLEVPARAINIGPLSFLVDGPDLRDVSIGGTPVAQKIYLAVRDTIWGTIEPRIEDYSISETSDSVVIRYSAHFKWEEMDLWLSCKYVATSSGVLTCTLLGSAEGNFQYNRIGFCFLIDRNIAGSPYLIDHLGVQSGGLISTAIAPQAIIDGELYPYLGPFERFEMEPAPGTALSFSFQGDQFELEDQRNWSDGSFKLYSTPLEDGWPLQASPGQNFDQQVEICSSVSGFGENVESRSAPTAAMADFGKVIIGAELGLSLPAVGFGLELSTTLNKSQTELLRALEPSHVRLDISAGQPLTPEHMIAISESANYCRTSVELGFHLGDDIGEDIELMKGILNSMPVTRVLLFRNGEPVTDGRAVSSVKAALPSECSSVPVFAGTDLHFSDLNRYRPKMRGTDGIVFPVVPTVHVTDDTTVLDNAAALSDVVLSAKQLFGDIPIAVSPITLRPRFSAWSSEENGMNQPVESPDPRQSALFGAIWSLKSLKYLAEAGVSSTTYYQCVGPKGLMSDPAVENEDASTYPAYRFFSWLAGLPGAALFSCDILGSDDLIGLALRDGSQGVRLLIGNQSRAAQKVKIDTVENCRVEYLDEQCFLTDGTFSADRFEKDASDGVFTIGPYGLACIDISG